METKKFKIQKAERTKGGFNNTRTVLTGAGIAAIGGAAAGAGYAAMTGGKNEPIEPKPEEQNTQTTTETTEEQQGQQQTTSQSQQQPQQPTPNEYQPTGGGAQQTSTNHNGGGNTNGSEEGDVDPNIIAQELKDEIDTGDIDVPNMLTVEEFGTVYSPDGSEMTVAVVHTADGTQYQLADIDGDGIFSDVFYMDGTFAGTAEGNLTASDLEEMADPTGGYLAYDGDDATAGITDTGGGQVAVDVAQQENVVDVSDSDTISDEELLAILTEVDSEDNVIDEEDEIESDIESDDYDVTENDGDYEYEG